MGTSHGGPRDMCGSESPWRWPSTVREEASGPQPGGRGAIAGTSWRAVCRDRSHGPVLTVEPRPVGSVGRDRAAVRKTTTDRRPRSRAPGPPHLLEESPEGRAPHACPLSPSASQSSSLPPAFTARLPSPPHSSQCPGAAPEPALYPCPLHPAQLTPTPALPMGHSPVSASDVS